MIITKTVQGQELMFYSRAVAAGKIGKSTRTLKRYMEKGWVPLPYLNGKKTPNGYNFFSWHEVNLLQYYLHYNSPYDDRHAFRKETIDNINVKMQQISDAYAGVEGATIPEEALRSLEDEEDPY